LTRVERRFFRLHTVPLFDLLPPAVVGAFPALGCLVSETRFPERVLPPMYENDPIRGVSDKLEEIKNLCRPEKRLESLAKDEFCKGIEQGFDGMIRNACKIAHCIRSYVEERGISRPPTPESAALSRIETTADDTNETVRRLDNRDRRHRDKAGHGAQLGLAVMRKCRDLWRDCTLHPEWFGSAADKCRVTKKVAYDYLVKHRLLPSSIDCQKTFCRALDSARKLK